MYRSLLSRSRTSVTSSGPLCIALAGVLWGTSGVVVQLIRARTGLSPAGIACYRLAVAALVLLPVTGARPLLRAARAAPAGLALTGAGLAAYQALYFIAVADAGVTVATVVSIGLAPVALAAWEAVRERRRPTMLILGTLAAALAGLILITASSGHAGGAAPRPIRGLLAAAGCGLGYAATTAWSRHLGRTVRATTMTTASLAVGAVVLAPAAIGSGLPSPPAALGLLAYLGVIATAVAYALFYAGLHDTPGSSAVILTMLEPVTAALLAWLILAEPLSGTTVAGSVLLLAAVLTPYRTAGAVTARAARK